MPLNEGERVGPYEVLGTLGLGGMGDMLRALDHRTDREVAIQVLKQTSPNADHQNRFVQEARAASALNHPNVVTIYDVGIEDGTPYIVSELVGGESLRAVMMRRSLSLEKIVDLAVQIAAGLVAAHMAGIVHGDLEPSKIMVTPTGLAKILDFGVAKQPAVRPGSLRARPEAGVSLGMATYMSPEQVAGDPVDAKSDQFSFGQILYEMLAGVPPFERGTVRETMRAIAGEDFAPLETLNPNAPVALRWIVERCLAKDREKRYGATMDLWHDLQKVRDHLSELTPASAEVPPARPAVAVRTTTRRPAALKLAIAAGLAVAALLAIFWLVPDRNDFSSSRATPLATSAAFQGSPAWAPDGVSYAFTAGVGDIRQLFVSTPNAAAPAQLTRSVRDCDRPFWSPDGLRVYYLSADDGGQPALWSIAATGGAPSLVRPGVIAAAISRDGELAFLQKDADVPAVTLWTAARAGADPQRYTQGPFASGTYRSGFIKYSPDGKSLGAWLEAAAGPAEFWVIPFPDGAPKRALPQLQQASGFSWMPDNRRIVFGGAVRGAGGPGLHIADLRRGTVTAIPKTDPNASLPAVSKDGRRIAFTVTADEFALVTVPLSGASVRPLLATSRSESSPAWNSDGSQLAYVTDRTGASEIWVKDWPNGAEKPLLTEASFTQSGAPGFSEVRYSPDGRNLAFTVNVAGASSIYVAKAAGGTPVKLTDETLEEHSPTWSPDGKTVAYARYRDGNWTVATASSSGGGDSTVVLSVPGLRTVRWSPAGNWIACGTATGLQLLSPDGKQLIPLSASHWDVFGWTKDGIKIVGVERDALGQRVLTMLNPGAYTRSVIGPLALPEISELRGFSLSPDGQAFAMAMNKPRADIWMIESEPGAEPFYTRLMHKIAALYPF